VIETKDQLDRVGYDVFDDSEPCEEEGVVCWEEPWTLASNIPPLLIEKDCVGAKPAEETMD
jgi:hypothetical protein